MSRRLLSTAAALMLAGGVYLSTGTAEASNMGFKLERSLSYVTGSQNLYLVSFPLFNGLGDIATSATGMNSCSAGDGIIDAADALCDLATDKDSSVGGGLMTIQRLNETTCQFEGKSILKTGPGTFLFVGDFTEELTTPANREVGYFLNVNKNDADPDLENRAVIVGSHDPSWAGKMVTNACPFTVLNLPYHTMYRSMTEVLCGLEGVDWVDDFDNTRGTAGADGKPDSCTLGLFDAASGTAVSVQTFDNGRNIYDGISVFLPTPTAPFPFFIGPNLDLTPGDAYVFNMDAGYGGGLWLPPHF